MIAAADFFTTEVWRTRGLVTHYTLFVIDHATLPIEILGTTPHPDTTFMLQVARNITNQVDGFLRAKRKLIIDRDPLYSRAFEALHDDAGVELVKIPPSSPDCNAIDGSTIAVETQGSSPTAAVAPNAFPRRPVYPKKVVARPIRKGVASPPHETPTSGIRNRAKGPLRFRSLPRM